MKNVPRSSPPVEESGPRAFGPFSASTEFRCPKCGGKRWGTRTVEGVEIGACAGTRGHQHSLFDRCSFVWLRSDDWTVFRDVETGYRFGSFAAFELACRR
jgi:hypothetical protein